MHVDLAEGRDVDHSDTGAHRPRLADVGLLDRLAGLGVDPRAQPRADGDHLGAVGDVPVVHRRQPGRAEMAADLAAGQRADGDRGVRRSEGGGADRRDRLAAQRRHQREGADVAGLALVGGHPLGGVALQVLDADVAFAVGQRHVGGGHVVLQVDELLDLAALGRGDLPNRPHAGAFRPLGAGRDRRRGGVEPGAPCRLGTGAGAVGETVGEGEHPARRAAGNPRFARLARQERGEGLVVDRPAPGHGVEVHRRRPAAGNGDQVAIDALADAAVDSLSQHRRPYPPPAFGGQHRMTLMHHDARRLRGGDQPVVRCLAHVGDGGHRRCRTAPGPAPRRNRCRCW